MKIILFYHSVISDWNHGNAHFLRGIISSLHAEGHKVQVMEPQDGWSLKNLLQERGLTAYHEFREFFPYHLPIIYSERNFDPEEYLYDADLVIVHEWNNPEIVKKIGDYKSGHKRFILLFHDTHHRSVTKPDEMKMYDLKNYDGVLAFGELIREVYLQNGWAKNVWTWHQAADSRIFHPVYSQEKEGDLVWIGNWGDDERTEELEEFIIDPVRELGLKACFYGVRYPSTAVKMLKKAGIKYAGWLPNYKVPEVFSQFRVTVHVPRKPYVSNLPGIPGIRAFEAMACGIPLICSPWNDREGLFTIGQDYLLANDGNQMKKYLTKILSDEKFGRTLSAHAIETINNRHTCDHRISQLMSIYHEIQTMKRETEFSNSLKVEQQNLN